MQVNGKRSQKEFSTQLAFAKAGHVTPEMSRVAQKEGVTPEFVLQELANGRLIIPANIRHSSLEAIGIGIALACKVNANIGASGVCSELEDELKKLEACRRFGADTVMDLTADKDVRKIREIRKAILECSPLPVGTVPIYEALTRVHGRPENLSIELFLDVIAEQAEEGVDYFTIHAGLLREHLPLTAGRITGIVSRGGGIMAAWMAAQRKQSFLYEHFGRILEVMRKFDVSISLGDALRPGSIHDATDKAQLAELKTLGELAAVAQGQDVQVMIEGPGHVPLDQIRFNMEIERELCHEAPFYVLGPLTTDIAAGYDHIAGAIGAAMAGLYGASLLCYVTPKEHLGLPFLEDVKQGLVAFKIAAHSVNVAKKRQGAHKRDEAMARARFRFDWEEQFSLALDPETARTYHDETLADEEHKKARFCSMCGPGFCPMALSQGLTAGETNETVEKPHPSV
jgi:phosphomethylpyrimidine synthase